MTKSKIQSLRETALFSCADQHGLELIERIAVEKNFRPHGVIFAEGAEARGFYIVLKGKVKVYKLSSAGSERILHIIAQGETLAEAVVFGGISKYPAFAEALAESTLLWVPKEPFLQLMKSDFSLTLSVLSSLTAKLKYFNRLVEELSLKSADARVAKYFLDLAVRAQSDSFSLDLKKNQLAQRLGIVPETLSRIFKKFKSRRWVRMADQQVTLLNKNSLLRISCGDLI